MANEKINGSEIFLRMVVDEAEAFIVCEQTSELSISAEGVTVQCKSTGEWVEQLSGGTKTGSISFTGAVVRNIDDGSLSFEDVFSSVGLVRDWVWGGTLPGEFIISTKAKLASLSITGNQNEAVTFTMELEISEEPELTIIST
jgi:TP901-1 family phage major tail protein